MACTILAPSSGSLRGLSAQAFASIPAKPRPTPWFNTLYLLPPMLFFYLQPPSRPSANTSTNPLRNLVVAGDATKPSQDQTSLRATPVPARQISNPLLSNGLDQHTSGAHNHPVSSPQPSAPSGPGYGAECPSLESDKLRLITWHPATTGRDSILAVWLRDDAHYGNAECGNLSPSTSAGPRVFLKGARAWHLNFLTPQPILASRSQHHPTPLRHPVHPPQDAPVDQTCPSERRPSPPDS